MMIVAPEENRNSCLNNPFATDVSFLHVRFLCGGTGQPASPPRQEIQGPETKLSRTESTGRVFDYERIARRSSVQICRRQPIREVMFLRGMLSIERMCQLVPASRKSFYRSLKGLQPAEVHGLKHGRSEKLTLDMRRPAVFILASPHLHRFCIALDLSVFRIQMQFPVNLPRDVGKLQHRNGNVPD